MDLQPDMFAISSLVGSVAFALSGFLAGVRHRLDIMGIFIVAMLTANGGGAIRDVLVGRTPLVLADPQAFYLVIGVIVLAALLKAYRQETLEKNMLFVLSDAIGLVAFSVTGTLVGIDAGLSFFGVMVLAFITASGGGMIRDIMVNTVPSILSSDFYGSVALLLALALYLLHQFGMMDNLSIAIAFFVALGLRLLAYYRGWHLPRINV